MLSVLNTVMESNGRENFEYCLLNGGAARLEGSGSVAKGQACVPESVRRVKFCAKGQVLWRRVAVKFSILTFCRRHVQGLFGLDTQTQ